MRFDDLNADLTPAELTQHEEFCRKSEWFRNNVPESANPERLDFWEFGATLDAAARAEFDAALAAAARG